MSLIAPSEGEEKLLEYMLGLSAPPTLKLRLYTAPITEPVEDWTYASITEASGNGYAALNLDGGWAISTISNITVAYHPLKTFTFTSGSVAVYGYCVCDDAAPPATTILWAERFTGAPFMIGAGGGTIDITPEISLD